MPATVIRPKTVLTGDQLKRVVRAAEEHLPQDYVDFIEEHLDKYVAESKYGPYDISLKDFVLYLEYVA